MGKIKVITDTLIQVKTEPKEDVDEKSINTSENNFYLNFPIPFKEEPDLVNTESTEKFLNNVCAAVKANIAEINEDLIHANDKQFLEARKQMEALQNAFSTGKFRSPLTVKKSKKTHSSQSKTSKGTNITDNVSEIDSDDDLLKCKVCKRIFNDHLSLQDHSNNQTAISTCCACGKSFKDNSQLNIHHRKHTGEKPYSCKECGKKFSIKGNLHKHIRTHTGERRFECSVCQKKFFQFAHLDDHIKTHTGERPFNCDECHSAFRSKSLLNKHKKNHDENSVKKRCLRCRICLKVMETSKQLYDHMKTHSDDQEPFKCVVCGKVYKSLCYLQGHERMHEGVKPFKCSVCDKAFVMSSQLKRHQNTHAGLKPFPCQICSRAFGVLQNLKRHLLTHTGDKPFSCQICGKGFLTFENMTRHTRIHTGEKPFSCDICGKKFAHSTTVKEHQRTHTGDKPFGCCICNKRFATNKVLFRHIRVRHPELSTAFQKVKDIPIQVRSQVAHNFAQDEYQEPEYIKTADIFCNIVKEEQDDEEDKPLSFLRSHFNNVPVKTGSIPSKLEDEDVKPLIEIADSIS